MRNNRGYQPRVEKKAAHRINNLIRVPEVRLVGENIEPGVYKISEALRLAEEFEVDLVEISPNAEPPVCKLMDYGKFIYEQKKREKMLKAKSTQIVV
ncbi:MAG TPA: translation initiation factor IF-3, partial [Flavobacterium sp.]|nr:translation initiation factor IF-3 [Flavobacterium sp.]